MKKYLVCWCVLYSATCSAATIRSVSQIELTGFYQDEALKSLARPENLPSLLAIEGTFGDWKVEPKETRAFADGSADFHFEVKKSKAETSSVEESSKNDSGRKRGWLSSIKESVKSHMQSWLVFQVRGDARWVQPECDSGHLAQISLGGSSAAVLALVSEARVHLCPQRLVHSKPGEVVRIEQILEVDVPSWLAGDAAESEDSEVLGSVAGYLKGRLMEELEQRQVALTHQFYEKILSNHPAED